MRKYWYILLLLIAGFMVMPVSNSYACARAGSCCKKQKQPIASVKKTNTTPAAHACGCSGKCRHSGCTCSASCNNTVSLLPPVFYSLPVLVTIRQQQWHYSDALPPSVYLSCKLPPKIS